MPKYSDNQGHSQKQVLKEQSKDRGQLMAMHSHSWKPLTDVYENDENIIVRVEIAGMKEQDFSIELNGRMLKISGIRQDTPERRAFHQMEIPFGEFQLELALPHPIEPEQIQAVYSDGFLRIRLPKARARHIPIGE
jgi:HSP20 family protein